MYFLSKNLEPVNFTTLLRQTDQWLQILQWTRTLKMMANYQRQNLGKYVWMWYKQKWAAGLQIHEIEKQAEAEYFAKRFIYKYLYLPNIYRHNVLIDFIKIFFSFFARKFNERHTNNLTAQDNATAQIFIKCLH